ncbi:hypothetical protein HRR83_001794 [Exophiala dermatitidis]|uniref:Zn(2)-C6 fungal-type domain-containing protein n=1 Tax=Exophiala dermatitidis TaxID=5970 RepID=A0AAN6F2E1_EXODE|nr:hypothetical protein HRR73_004925 [Exophiala dermatitidis]KAJ4526597.1 hypothetical protein HRR74_001797 [Exophiala dermatitidis]KAJ4532155.1 hypothetical protein HRR76_007154 [Exophiala dermatitidis]KAJ4546191.1 hypothetical protein HRR77_004727 [Exophiala dermatitidis]KAJ4567564.1 hypothetical protein HRR79_005078 [Exophiala dermatitidis]
MTETKARDHIHQPRPAHAPPATDQTPSQAHPRPASYSRTGHASQVNTAHQSWTSSVGGDSSVQPQSAEMQSSKHMNTNTQSVSPQLTRIDTTGTSQSQSQSLSPTNSRKRSIDQVLQLQLQPPEPLAHSASGTISRKGRACLSCRKLKVKCDSLERGDAGCSRCQRLGLDCITSKRMRVSLSEDGEGGGENAHPAIVRLDRAVEDILARLKMPPLDSYLKTHPSQQQQQQQQQQEESEQQTQSQADSKTRPSLSPAAESKTQYHQPQPDATSLTAPGSGSGSSNSHPPGLTTHHSSSNHLNLESNAQTTRENSREPNAEDAHEMAPAPMGSLYEVTQLNTLRSRLKYGDPARRNSRKNMEHDLISMGVISLDEAEEMFVLFKTSLSRYLFDAPIHESRSLLSVRESSTLFFTAIITVTSLHIPGKEKIHAAAHKHLRDLIATSFFDRFHTLEDIRALCIAAFWLPDLSWKLSGHCVRMATELNLHQAFFKALYSQQKQSETERGHAFERARLWYLLYVLDHHFSIAYGRPPVTTELQAIKEYEVFLNAPECTTSDRRVLSQVTLFIILSRAYNHFGLEAERLMDGDDETLRTHQRFMDDLDSWRYQFRHALNRDSHVGDYPGVGVELHYHFASMMLNSLALRGRSLATISSTSTLPLSLRPLASHAILSAHQILGIVLQEPSIRDSMVGVPLYLHTVIAFAVVFLIKMSSRWTGIGVNIDPEVKTRPLIEAVIDLFRACRAGRNHILYAMADGFERLLVRNLGNNNGNSNVNGHATNGKGEEYDGHVGRQQQQQTQSQHQGLAVGPALAASDGGGGSSQPRLGPQRPAEGGGEEEEEEEEAAAAASLQRLVQQSRAQQQHGPEIYLHHQHQHQQHQPRSNGESGEMTQVQHYGEDSSFLAQRQRQLHHGYSTTPPTGVASPVPRSATAAATTTTTTNTNAPHTVTNKPADARSNANTDTNASSNNMSLSTNNGMEVDDHRQNADTGPIADTNPLSGPGHVSASRPEPGHPLESGAGSAGAEVETAEPTESYYYEGWQTEDDMLWSMGMGYDLLAMAPDVNALGLGLGYNGLFSPTGMGSGNGWPGPGSGGDGGGPGAGAGPGPGEGGW